MQLRQKKTANVCTCDDQSNTYMEFNICSYQDAKFPSIIFLWEQSALILKGTQAVKHTKISLQMAMGKVCGCTKGPRNHLNDWKGREDMYLCNICA